MISYDNISGIRSSTLYFWLSLTNPNKLQKRRATVSASVRTEAEPSTSGHLPKMAGKEMGESSDEKKNEDEATRPVREGIVVEIITLFFQRRRTTVISPAKIDAETSKTGKKETKKQEEEKKTDKVC